MKQKLYFSLSLMLLCIFGSSPTLAETVDDLVAISDNYTFIADDFTSNGTEKLNSSTLYDNGRIFTPTGNTVATNKGKSMFGDVEHLNSLRLKNTQDQLCFKVAEPCTVTFYTQSHNSRGLQVGSAEGGTEYGSQPVSTSEWSCDITSAGVVYLSSFNGDFYIAGFKVTFPKPEITAQPQSATYLTGAEAEPLSVTATTTEEAMSYQWYSCADADRGESVAINGAKSSTYTPPTDVNGTYYYYCCVSDAKGSTNSDVATILVSEGTEPTIFISANTNANQGAEVVFTATVGGVPTPQIQWFSCDSNGANSSLIPEATGTTYSPSTETSGAYYFYATATNENGVTMSNIVELTVNPQYTVTYEIGEGAGVAPAALGNIDGGTTITLPRNFTMYKEGYTMTGWSDGTTTYDIGASYTVNGDVTLTAQYTENTVSLSDITKATGIVFDFRRENGAPIVQWEKVEDQIWVAQATVKGVSIDVPMIIKTGAGKFNNSANTDCAQVNSGTILTIPSVAGATIEMGCHSSFSISTTTIDGSTEYTGTGTSFVSYNVTSDNNPVEIVIGDGSYYQFVSVILPSPALVLSATEPNTQFILSKENIDNYDYVSVSVDTWVSNKEYGDGKYVGDFYNMAKNTRNITMKVTGASSFEVYVQNSTANRTYTVQYGENDAVTVTHGGTGVEKSQEFTIDDPTAETSIVLAGTGSSVYPVAIVFNPVPSFDYSVKAMDVTGAELATIASGNTTEESVTVSYPRAIKVEDVWYLCPEGTTDFSVEVTSENANAEIVYTADESVIYFKEAEDLEDPNQTYTDLIKEDATCSGGKYLYMFTGPESFNIPEDGTYQLEANVVDRTQGGGLCVYTSESNDIIAFLERNKKGIKTCEFAATANTQMRYGAPYYIGRFNYSFGFDYVLIRKVSDECAVYATITDAGWATLYTDKALDFSNSTLKAYVATINDKEEENTVTLIPVTEVPANVGVVLQGTAGTYTIPVIESAAIPTGGNLTGTLTGLAYEDFEQGYTYYILATVNDGKDVQFVPCNGGTIAAGKAFLKLATSQSGQAKAMRVVLASETTGISNVNVSVPVPVKRIQNGQLVIEKNSKTYNAAGQQK